MRRLSSTRRVQVAPTVAVVEESSEMNPTIRRIVRSALLLCVTACSSSDRQNPPDGESPEGLAAAVADCPADDVIDAFVADWRARRPTRAIVGPDGGLEAALCAQAKIVSRLQAELGPIVGHKAGLTSPPAQERFGAQEPVRGVLLRDMLLESGVEVDAAFGARPMFEGDLLVEVADEGVNQATSAEEVLAHIRSVIPFVELPDLAVAEGEPLNGRILTAINVAARLGVMGQPIPAERNPEFLRSLADMVLHIVDQTGAELATAPGSAVLGHPLNSVIWLVRDGIRLREGDLVSVGSIGPLLPVQAGQTVTINYDGLAGGNPTVTVRFR